MTKPRSTPPDPAPHALRSERQALDAIFSPKAVAVIGATDKPGSVGRTILWNLISSPFGGTVYPVNPSKPSILGIKAYQKLDSVPEQIDLAVIVTPAPTVPEVIAQCAETGVKGAIIISAGFRECGEEGAGLEKRILAEARRGRVRIVGPNCLGVMSPQSGLNATFASAMACPGSVGFVSQSGALCSAILDWSFQVNVGFSAFISIGSMLDIGWGDVIDYLGDDPHTRSIVIYMESIGDARAFISAAREVALSKPIIVIKTGRTEAAAKAAASHTGSLAGSDDLLDAAFRRSGVLRVNSVADLFYMAEVLAKQPRPKGPRLTILTNAGGPGVLATDELIATGGELAVLSHETVEALNQFLPPHWSHGNPIDILGDAGFDRYGKAVEAAAKDQNTQGLLVILTPQAMTDPTQTAEQLKRYARLEDKPLLASWMGGSQVAAGNMILTRAGVPTFSYPETAARAFNYMWKYSYNLRGIYETPSSSADSGAEEVNRPRAEQILREVRASGRTLLTEFESKLILACYGIPAVETRIAQSESESVAHAEATGYPVALKLHSKTITHKSDVGGVQLNLRDAQEVRLAWRAIESAVRERASPADFCGVTVQPMIRVDGYELIVGSSIDPQFGPVLLFGAGGQLVEIFQDRALALPPLNTTLARRMMEQTRVFTALKGVRGRKPADLDGLAELLVRFSQLVVDQRWIKEIDINPLLASPDRLLALDARIILHPREITQDELPKLAIRPYPEQYVSPWILKDGTEVTIRPIRPEDEPCIVKFHETLSEQSVYFRYFHQIKLSQRVTHERLIRICFIDYDRELALVAERANPETGIGEIIAVGRLIKIHGSEDADFAMLVSDRFQRYGLGTELLARLVRFGRDERLRRIMADILPENQGMQRVAEKLGFGLHLDPAEKVVKALLEL